MSPITSQNCKKKNSTYYTKRPNVTFLKNVASICICFPNVTKLVSTSHNKNNFVSEINF